MAALCAVMMSMISRSLGATPSELRPSIWPNWLTWVTRPPTAVSRGRWPPHTSMVRWSACWTV
eukprot:7032917-Pyramimonas_sp.AAC.1